MSGVYKVGCSTNDPVERARQLSAGSGIPYPYTVVYSRRVAFPFAVEANLHSQLDSYRINDSREFFKAPLHQIITLIERHDEVPEVGEMNEGPLDLSYSELFATFPDDGEPRMLTDEERAQCRELESRQ
jgi:hypothetical protein